MYNYIVGCPVYNRAWILPQWFDHVEKAFVNHVVKPYFLFVCNENDDETLQAISDNTKVAKIILVKDDDLEVKEHNWGPDRYNRMVFLRNKLLESVRELNPAIFISLDSDILLHPDAIDVMEPLLEKYDAVGGKTYMTHSDKCWPSYGIWGYAGAMLREESEGAFPVDVIMAIKMMNSKAYNIDYSFHTYGEDAGYSNNAKAAGLSLGWTGEVASKHVMSRDMLDKIDDRCGF